MTWLLLCCLQKHYSQSVLCPFIQRINKTKNIIGGEPQGFQWDIRFKYFLKIKTFIYNPTFKVIQWMLVSDLFNSQVTTATISRWWLVPPGLHLKCISGICRPKISVQPHFKFCMTLFPQQHFLIYSNLTMTKLELREKEGFFVYLSFELLRWWPYFDYGNDLLNTSVIFWKKLVGFF